MTGAQIVNVSLFIGALASLGGLLGVELVGQLAGGSQAISEEENRTLAPVPELRWSTIVDGSFARAAEAWSTDHFPARERFMEVHFWLEEHRGFRAPDEVALYAIAIDNDADLDPLDQAVELADLDELEDFVELEDLEASTAPDSIVRSEGILVVDGRAMQLFAGGPNGARGYARVMNGYVAALRGKVEIYSLIVPTAQTFYLPESYKGRVRHEPPNIAATYAMMDPSIHTVDVVSALADHADEYIYFRTDHHWTGRGAYYAYAAFCEAAGLTPAALDALEHATISPYRGSLYRYTRDSGLRRRPDQVEYWVPAVEASVSRCRDAAQTKFCKGALLRRNSKGYGVFLGGDHPLLIAQTANQTGRRALLIKNSYGNPFAPFLVAHFDEVVIVDYRKFSGSVLELIEERGITDLIILNGAITANAAFHVARLERVMTGGKRRPPKPRAATPAD